MLKKRLITALWGIPLVIAAVWFDEPIRWFTVLAAAAGILGVIEFYRMVGITRLLPLTIAGTGITALFIIYPEFNVSFNISLAALALIIISGILLGLARANPKTDNIYRLWAWTLTGALYIGWLISFLVDIRINAGRNWLFLTLFATFGCDTFAYFIGKAIGRHKMAPSISPGKTWEGAAGGIFGAVLVCYLFTLNWPLNVPLGIGLAMILGVLISIFGQIGDLAESKLKRGAGVKDSGTLMPGHGGIMDRLDSLLFAGVVVYLFYRFVFL